MKREAKEEYRKRKQAKGEEEGKIPYRRTEERTNGVKDQTTEKGRDGMKE